MSVEEIPLVSVILPNYNHAPYLKQRIESILTQSYPNIEVIILDDCSPDNSREIIEEYRNHPKVAEIIYNEKNSGSTFIQWEKGIQNSKGKYIWIAESDDFADGSFLETLVRELEKNPEAVMAFSGSIMVDSEGNPIPGMDWDRYKPSDKNIEVYAGDEIIRKKLLWTADIYNASMVVFRREKAPEIEPVQRKMRYCGDWLFWFNLACRGGGIEIRKKLNRFRQHQNKVSTDASKSGLYFYEGLPIMVRIAEKLKLNETQRKMLAGRTLKRLRKFPNVITRYGAEINSNLERLAPGSVRKSRRMELIYELDKYLNFTGLQR